MLQQQAQQMGGIGNAARGLGAPQLRRQSPPNSPLKSAIRQLGIQRYPQGINTMTPRQPISSLGSFKKGGEVKKTGEYKLHKGEEVISKAKRKALANKKK